MNYDLISFEDENSVTLSLEEYQELLDAERMLSSLYECGVSDWGGYYAAEINLARMKKVDKRNLF